MNRKVLLRDSLLIIGMILGSAALFMMFPAKKEAANTANTMQDQNQPQVKIEVEKEGTGSAAENGQMVLVDYTGMLTDGTVFDSSIPRGEPFAFTLGGGEVIKGWDIGVLGMKVGEKRRLTVPPELGYGTEGFPGVIPPNATLVFDVELKAIK